MDPAKVRFRKGRLRVEKALHWAAAMENRFHALLGRWARRRKFTEVITAAAGYGCEDWIRILGRVLMVRPSRKKSQLDPENRLYTGNLRGWRSLFSIPVPYAEITLRIGSKTFGFKADRGGVIDAKIQVRMDPGVNAITLKTPNSAAYCCNISVAENKSPVGVISDIDDTVMITKLPRPLIAAWNAFVVSERARAAVAGMNVLYEKLARAWPGALFIYLSTGAWNAGPALVRFLERYMYPTGPLLLTDWGPTHDRWFRNGLKHKEENLRRLILEFPDTRWVLIGDDGQHDVELYSKFAREYPENIEAILIRKLYPAERFFLGRRRSKKIIPVEFKILYGYDGSELYKAMLDLDFPLNPPPKP